MLPYAQPPFSPTVSPCTVLRKAVKLQLRHFWLLRRHKSKQKCRLAIESEREQKNEAKRKPKSRTQSSRTAWLWALPQKLKPISIQLGYVSIRILRLIAHNYSTKAVKQKQVAKKRSTFGHYDFRPEGWCPKAAAAAAAAIKVLAIRILVYVSRWGRVRCN